MPKNAQKKRSIMATPLSPPGAMKVQLRVFHPPIKMTFLLYTIPGNVNRQMCPFPTSLPRVGFRQVFAPGEMYYNFRIRNGFLESNRSTEISTKP